MATVITKKKTLHCFVKEGCGEKVFLWMIYSEWCERTWSDDCSSKWCITLEDGSKAFDCPDLARKKSHHCPGNWPMTSYAAGGHPDDIPEMQRIDKEHGVPTEYTNDGDPIFTSRKHRKEYCEAHKLFDRNAGYSDPVPAH